MTFILEKQPNITSRFLIVCEGMGDAHLVNLLLEHHGIPNCQVGCPSNDSVGGMGKEKIPDYLGKIQSAVALNGAVVDGLLLIGDADKSQAEALQELSDALTASGYPLPSGPYRLELAEFHGKQMRIGIYIIPAQGRDGTLEHLLMDAVREATPHKEICIDTLMNCVGAPVTTTPNQLAKMKMSILIGASCKNNPFASSGLALRDRGNPIPIASASLTPLADFLREFSAPLD